MPKRRGIRRVPSDEVQGEGSWVEVAELTVKEVRAMKKQSKADDFDDLEASIDLLKTHVRNWNWVDADGADLPTPKAEPDIIEELMIIETNFLAGALLGEDTESKN